MMLNKLAVFCCVFVLVSCGESDSLDNINGIGGEPVLPILQFSNFKNADIVIGQSNFTSGSPNGGGSINANTFNEPIGSAGVNNNILYLSDSFNSRVLGFNSIPSINNANSDFVLGQVDFTSSDYGISSTRFGIPSSPSFSNGKMMLLSRHRILIWNNAPTSGEIPADVVIGQSSFSSNVNSCSGAGVDNPAAVWSVAGKIIVSDFNNHRVLIWNSVPTTNNQPADLVLGQQSFNNCAANDNNDDGVTDTASASTLNRPRGIWSDGVRLVVADASNNRVLIWNTFPTSSFAPADVVLGQANFINMASNDDNQDGSTDVSGLATSRVMYIPSNGIFSNGTQLFVPDSFNNRVLIWNDFPTTNFTPADRVLGQSDFSHVASNDDNQDGISEAITARTLAYPTGVLQVNNQLIVTDSNNRYLIYK